MNRPIAFLAKFLYPFSGIVYFFTISFIIPVKGMSQDSADLIPDGTQGEQLEVLKNDSSKQKWRDKRWRLFNGRFTTFKFGGGFLTDCVAYSQDENSKKQMDSLGTPLEPEVKIRDFRVVASGQLKTKRVINWKLGLMYDGTLDAWLFRETGVMVEVKEINSSFFVGRTKEGFSMNKVMNGYSGWTMERQMALDVIPILADGIKWMGYLPKSRVFWNLGIFTDWLSEGQSFSTYKWQFASRIGWLPVNSPADNKVLHLGINYRYGQPKNGEIQLRSKPESNPSPYFVSTGKFASTASNQVGYEIYYRSGQWLFGSESYLHAFKSSTKDDPVFRGGEFVATYLFNGGVRPYYNSTSIFGFVPVKKSIFKRGWGEFEAVLRYSFLNLNSGPVNGGKFWKITPMVNWYMSKDIRLELGYGYGVLDRFQMKGATSFFQSRLQLTLL
jgi:phosphate-selective porin OprO/OprP